MSFYSERVFPHVMDKVMDTAQTREARQEVCEGLVGEVVEIGFGTGHNLRFLPPGVTRLLAVEPLGVGVRIAAPRIAASGVPVEVCGLDGQSLPLDDASVDAALCTWSLCSIPDPVQAVREVRRVLKPGGSLHFVEHGRAPDARVLAWQARLNPLQKRVAAGCHLDRDIPGILEAGGLTVTALSHRYERATPKLFGSLYVGRAVAS